MMTSQLFYQLSIPRAISDSAEKSVFRETGSINLKGDSEIFLNVHQ